MCIGHAPALDVALQLIGELIGWPHSCVRRAVGECAGVLARLEAPADFTDKFLVQVRACEGGREGGM